MLTQHFFLLLASEPRGLKETSQQGEDPGMETLTCQLSMSASWSIASGQRKWLNGSVDANKNWP